MRRRACLALIAGAGAAVLAQPWARAADAAAAPRVFVWRGHGAGGYSALALDAAGATALALTDRGLVQRLLFERDAAGAIAAVHVTLSAPLRGPDGAPLPPGMTDSEGLAVDPETGRFWVAFEGKGGGRVWAYAGPAAPAEPLPQPPAFARLPGNGGLEALARDAAGRLFAIPETGNDGRHPLFRHDAATGWAEVATLRAPPGFRPVGADFGLDGRLYLLWRAFRLPMRFGAHLSRCAPGDWVRQEPLWHAPPGTTDNLEGLSVTRDAAGRLRATMISDDNLRPWLQRTEIVELALPD
jgi:hypothetical protein